MVPRSTEQINNKNKHVHNDLKRGIEITTSLSAGIPTGYRVKTV